MRNNNIFGELLECVGLGIKTGGALVELITIMFWAGLLVLFAPFWLFWVLVKGLCDIA